jgi:hypothetical protein
VNDDDGPLIPQSAAGICRLEETMITVIFSVRVRGAINGLLIGALLLSGALTRASETSVAAATDVYFDYTARIDSVNFHHVRSIRTDDDWLYYEIRVLDSNNNQVFYDKREGHLTKPNGSTTIRNGDFIAFTHPQGLWENPYVINFKLRESDVAVCTYTILNQSHESHDPNKQRQKWGKFVSSQQKAVVIGEIIALPIGAGIAYGSVSAAYLALLQGISELWDAISPPAKENVDCDGPVVTGYWKYTAADLLARTNNARRSESIRGRFRDPNQARKECESIPDTEVFLSIERGQNMGGQFPSTPPPIATTDRPASRAPDGVWLGTWVDRTDVSDSRIIVQVVNPPAAREGRLGVRLRSCNVTTQASYNVSLKELAAPVSGSLEFQQSGECLTPTQANSSAAPPFQVKPNTDGIYAPQPSQGGIATRRKPGTLYERQPGGGSNPPPPPAAPAAVVIHILKPAPNVTLELYEALSNQSVIGYRLRYLRKADDGSVIKDVKLTPAGSPIR